MPGKSGSAHEFCLNLLMDYIVGDLPDESRSRIESHLDSGCVLCMNELRQLQEAFHSLPFALQPASVASDLKSRIDVALDAGELRHVSYESISHYRILQKLGFGAMGEVYLAEDTKLGRSTALKIIRPEYASNEERKKRFLREARAAAALNHPGIATIYEIGQERGTEFIAMEYVEGRPLTELISRVPLSSERIIDFGIQLANALTAAHAKGVLHRDLKPDNIHVKADQHLKILDFGLAKFTEAQTEEDYTTETDRILGTVPYMSPEQIQGKPLGARSDLFSLGCILYQMCCGRAPFTGENPAATIENILYMDPAPPSRLNPGIPVALESVILRCLEKDPDDRYGSAKELESDLRKAQKGEEPEANKASNESRSISIAVLYFENLSEEKESDYFRAGMTEDIIIELSNVKAWQVRPRTQVVRFMDQPIDPREVGRELKVSHVLQGSIRKAGPRLRISAQLVDAHTATSVWADRYDSDLKDVFEIQAEIARRIAAALQVHLSSAEKKEIARKPTNSVEAYDSYLRGREMIFTLSKEGIDSAIEFFTQAVGADSKFALAYAGLAQAYATKLSFYGGPDELADLAIEYGKKALTLDTRLAQAYAALGLAYLLKRMESEAIDACEKALELNPDDAFATWISGRLSYRLNRYHEALGRFQKTIDLLPDFYTAYSDLGQTYENLGLKKDAAELQEQTAAACHRYIDARPNEARAHIFLANACARLGRREDAIREGLIAVGLAPDDPVMMYNMACLYSLLNEQDSAVQWLTKSVQNGRRDFEWLKRDPSLSNIRNHPGYKKLIGP